MANDEDLPAEPQGEEDKDEDPGESTPAGPDLPPVLLPKVPGGVGQGNTRPNLAPGPPRSCPRFPPPTHAPISPQEAPSS